MNLNFQLISFYTFCIFALAFGNETEVDSLISSINGPVSDTIAIETVDQRSRIEGSYILAFSDDLPQEYRPIIEKIITLLNGTMEHRYETSIVGYSVRFNSRIPLRQIQRIPYLEFIEEDQIIVQDDIQNVESEWGLDVLDGYPRDHKYQFDYSGRGVNIYIVDGRVKKDHEQFGDRVKTIYSAIKSNETCLLHGTHIAGITGGKTVGVARDANLFSLEILDCMEGSISDLLAAIDFVILNHKKPAVLNLSISPSTQSVWTLRTVYLALKKAITEGIVAIKSAGNEGINPCSELIEYSDGLLTVGAVDENLKRGNYSNYGECINIFAPGSNILSAGPDGDLIFKSGTSMATPFVAGVAALYLEKFPDASPQEIISLIKQDSLKNLVTDPKGSQNLLVQIPKQVTLPSNSDISSKEESVNDLSRKIKSEGIDMKILALIIVGAILILSFIAGGVAWCMARQKKLVIPEKV